MRQSPFIGSMGAALVIVGASLGVAAPSFAQDGQDTTVEALAELNPGTGEEQLLAEADELAEELGATPEAILAQQLVEAEESAAAASGGRVSANRSSGGGGTVTLGNATRKGDIFVSPASTLFVEHGHTGIYYTTATIVEAPGTNENSRSVSANSLKVSKGAVKQNVLTTQANRNKAANYAYNNMRGKPYNTNFANNRHVPASSYNCSQLVWGAYKQTTSIDVDSNGGLGVYPYNIKDSSKTVTYKTL